MLSIVRPPASPPRGTLFSSARPLSPTHPRASRYFVSFRAARRIFCAWTHATVKSSWRVYDANMRKLLERERERERECAFMRQLESQFQRAVEISRTIYRAIILRTQTVSLLRVGVIPCEENPKIIILFGIINHRIKERGRDKKSGRKASKLHFSG